MIEDIGLLSRKTRMNIPRKIIFLCALHCAVALDGMSTEWNQTLTTSIAWLSKVNKEELFYDTLTGANNVSLAVLDWVNPVADRTAGFNLTTITHFFNGRSMGINPCSFPADENIDFATPVKVVYLRNDRVLVYFTKTHKTQGFIQVPQVINPETCKLLESTNTEPYVKFAAVYIVRFENTFDVLFENRELCPDDSWCRLTFDHDGKKINEPTSIFSEKQNKSDVEKIYPINYEPNKEGLVVVAPSSGVYSPLRGWVPAEDLTVLNHFYTNTSGYASICWQTYDTRNFKCTWLDHTHKDKKGVTSTVTVPMNKVVKKMAYIYNTFKGKIAILHEGRDNNQQVIFSDTPDWKGKCKRYMKVQFADELKKMQLAIVNDDESCISLIARNPNPISENGYSSTYSYKFQTKCSEFSKGFHPEKIECGKDYTS